MRIPPTILCALVVCLAAAPAGAEEDQEPSERRTRSVLTPRFLPQVVDPASPIASFVNTLRDARAAPSPPRSPGLLTRLVRLRLRRLTGPTPADPRQQLGSGDLALRVPLGEALDLRPGVRVDYGRSPQEHLWTGDPTPTLGVGMRF